MWDVRDKSNTMRPLLFYRRTRSSNGITTSTRWASLVPRSSAMPGSLRPSSSSPCGGSDPRQPQKVEQPAVLEESPFWSFFVFTVTAWPSSFRSQFSGSSKYVFTMLSNSYLGWSTFCLNEPVFFSDKSFNDFSRFPLFSGFYYWSDLDCPVGSLQCPCGPIWQKNLPNLELFWFLSFWAFIYCWVAVSCSVSFMPPRPS